MVRGSAGLFYDRVPLRALANALLSAGNTTDLANLRQTSISLSPTQAAAPIFPNILSAPVPSVTLFNHAEPFILGLPPFVFFSLIVFVAVPILLVIALLRKI